MVLQRLLIRYLLDPLAKIMSRIPQKVKDAGFIFCFLWIIFLYMGRDSGLLKFRYFLFFALGCVGLGGMVLCTLPERSTPVSFRKSLIFL